MELLSISSTISPQILPQNPCSSSSSFLKSPQFLTKPSPRTSAPTIRSLSFSAPRNSLQFPQVAKSSPKFELGFGDIGLGPTMNLSRTPASAVGDAEADVMGLLLKQRIVFLGTRIDDFVADAIVSQLLLLDAQDHTKDIRLFINSCGGSFSATMAIFDVVQLVRADVSTVALGTSVSTASIILGGGAKGKRLAMPNARIMFHQPLGSASGGASNVVIQATEVMEHRNNIIRIISEFTGQSFEQVEKDIDKDRYMSPIEALEYGLIDGIIDRDSIIPLTPRPERVKSRFNFEEVVKDPRKFLSSDIPDDQIY
ncbi:hypothetical protein Cgig2_023052 [Carnegiea gigantea]|uniref:ATP-dependent Clp protease proteolytic subunit n=1 Tax=Carnegiea gigantea TaxID=171969 RepID=A0A9Q1JXP4_9CARY|nr:hypothetical protein Cgig2_023052 [Carnegiea gigantea]